MTRRRRRGSPGPELAPEFEKAALEYRKAIAAAERLRQAFLRAGFVGADKDFVEVEDRIRKAFGKVSEALGYHDTVKEHPSA